MVTADFYMLSLQNGYLLITQSDSCLPSSCFAVGPRRVPDAHARGRGLGLVRLRGALHHELPGHAPRGSQEVPTIVFHYVRGVFTI